MSELLVDVGNTRVKWALAGADGLRLLTPLAHGDAGWLDDAVATLAGTPAPRGVWIAAVASDALVDAFGARLRALWPRVAVHRVRTSAEASGVRVAYAEPGRFGVDRFVALLGARARTNGPCLVASLGTALAIDALSGDGMHHGGLIAPSPELMRASVLERTARVGWTRSGAIVPFGTSSEDGLESGCWLAAAALVERSIDEVVARDGACTTFLAGGGAPRLAPLVRRPCIVVEHLVLEGLARYAAKGPE